MMREIISRLVDNSEFEEFKNMELLCIGFLILWIPYGNANNGVLFLIFFKGTHFIQLCEQRRIPIVFAKYQVYNRKTFEEKGYKRRQNLLMLCLL